MFKTKTEYAFTLSEVLITLMIIGVIAAMTIPTVMQQIQDREFIAAWKNTYSELNQATISIINENGGNLENACTTDTSNCIKELYLKYYKTIKSCQSGESAGNCWHNSAEWTDLNNDSISWGDTAGFVALNGVLFRFEGSGFPDCTNDSWVNAIPKCAFINIDVNGFKKPNKIGKDIYLMILTKNRLLPLGTQDDAAHADDCNPNADGWGCAAKYLQN